MANNYDVNYDDKRFTQVETDKQEALTELENTYSGMIGKSDDFYNKQIQASEQWADKQSQLQQEQTDFTIEKIEQQREQAQKDYVKEQSGAYVDWQKQSNQYGVNAEQQAATGMTNTGFSESSQVSMYNTYQNRVATAREVFARANLNFDNGIKEAKMQNSAAIAEIKYKAYKEQLELGLQGFQYKNNLLLEQANKKMELENAYYQRYLDVLNQINHENAQAEEVRQFNEKMALEKAQFEEEKRRYNASQASSGGSGGSGGGTAIINKDKPTITAIENNEPTNTSGYTVVNSPLTPEGAAERVARGELNAEVVGNKIYVSRNPNYTQGQAILDKYTSLSSLPTKKRNTGGGSF